MSSVMPETEAMQRWINLLGFVVAPAAGERIAGVWRQASVDRVKALQRPPAVFSN